MKCSCHGHSAIAAIGIIIRFCQRVDLCARASAARRAGIHFSWCTAFCLLANRTARPLFIFVYKCCTDRWRSRNTRVAVDAGTLALSSHAHSRCGIPTQINEILYKSHDGFGVDNCRQRVSLSVYMWYVCVSGRWAQWVREQSYRHCVHREDHSKIIYIFIVHVKTHVSRHLICPFTPQGRWATVDDMMMTLSSLFFISVSAVWESIFQTFLDCLCSRWLCRPNDDHGKFYLLMQINDSAAKYSVQETKKNTRSNLRRKAMHVKSTQA